MKCKNRIAALLLAALLAFVLPVAAFAREIPDLGRTGTIVVEMQMDGWTVEGGSLAAYRVGEIHKEDADYSFVKTPELADFPGEYDDITSPQLAADLTAFIAERGIEPYATADNVGGTAFFRDVELGLYLIVQTVPCDGYEPLVPFLISVPMYEDGRYLYEVHALGKFELRHSDEPGGPSTTPAPTPVPPGTRLPQTGQLNWPIPVLAVLGLGLFSLGWALRFGKRKEPDEK